MVSVMLAGLFRATSTNLPDEQSMIYVFMTKITHFLYGCPKPSRKIGVLLEVMDDVLSEPLTYQCILRHETYDRIIYERT